MNPCGAGGDIKNLELKKHINAIHCSNNLTLMQRKLFNALLFNAYPELVNKSHFQIQTKKLCQLIGYNSNDYGKLKKALLGLITIAIEWNVIDCSTGQEKQWQASSILASAELSDGNCSYEYSQVMRKLLYQPDIYGRINIVIVSKFKSSYGLALYENCIRYQGLAQTPWFSLDIFKKLMGVVGEKYVVFKDFKKRVLNIAVDEVNAISPICVYPEIERQNQKVVKIRFRLDKKENSTASKVEPINEDADLMNTLVSTFGLSQKIADEVMEKYDTAYIREKATIVMHSDNFLSGKIRGVAGYFIEALKRDYKISKSSKSVVEEQRKIKATKENARTTMDEIKRKQYSDYVAGKISAYLASLPKEKYQDIEQSFSEHMTAESLLMQKWYAQYKFKHPGIRFCFYNFVKNIKHEDLRELLSYEEFIENCNGVGEADAGLGETFAG